MKIQRIYGASVIGSCLTCGREFEEYLQRRQAYSHAKGTGHQVTVEITNNFRYN